MPKYDGEPKDLRNYRIKKPYLNDELFFIYDTEEELARPNRIEQPSMPQHQIAFSLDPNFWVSEKVMDSLFKPEDDLYGHDLIEYPGSKGNIFVKSWQGTYTIGGELPWNFPEPGGCQEIFILGRARWFFANVNEQDGQMGGFYPSYWSPWSDITGIHIDQYKNGKIRYEKVFKAGTPGLFWWKRSWKKPEMPASRDGDWGNVKGWTHNRIDEDKDSKTPPVWRFTRHGWKDYHYKAIKREDSTLYTPDTSRPMYQRWDCNNLIAIDPDLQYRVERAEEIEKQKARDERLRKKQERQRKIEEQKERMAKRRREWAERDKKQAEIERKKAIEKAKYLAKREREQEERLFNDRYNEIMNYAKEMELSNDQLGDLIRRGYHDPQWDVYDPVFLLIAVEKGIELDR